jgi:type III pantothenate kinase
MAAVLCLDIGNTRLKWQVAFSGRLVAQGSCSSAAPSLNIPPSIARIVNRVAISSVAGADSLRALESELLPMAASGLEVVASTDAWGRLINGYQDPGKLGVDRWLAMVAASDAVGLPVVVVDAGTALTVDGIGASGKHLVGYIVPGLRTMLKSLGDATAGLGVEALSAATPGARSVSTRDAICNGVVEAARGLVDRAVGYLSEHEGREPAVVVTGGDRRLVAYEGSGWLLCPDLVLLGLRRVAGDLNQFMPP